MHTVITRNMDGLRAPEAYVFDFIDKSRFGVIRRPSSVRATARGALHMTATRRTQFQAFIKQRWIFKVLCLVVAAPLVWVAFVPVLGASRQMFIDR